MKTLVDWSRLRAGADARKAFEGLCCHLAEREPAPSGSEFKRLGAPDGGVECLRRLPDGAERGWQAKYFRDAPGRTQWRQIDRSARKALESHAGLQRYVVCAPVDLTLRGEDKWKSLVKKWRSTKPIAFEYWGRHELEFRLLNPKNHDLLKYYFDRAFLSAEWAEKTMSNAIADAGPRYTPEQNVDLPIAKSFQALCGTEELFRHLTRIASSVRDHLSAASTKPALDAAGGEFARLENAANDIASLFTGDDARKGGGIPAPAIKEKSHKAKSIISGIALSLADEGRKGGDGEQAGQDYASNPFDMELHRLRRLCDDLDELTDGRLSEDMDIHRAKALLVAGDAGVGKTHLFCDIAKRHTEQKQMTVLLHSSHFYAGPPKEAIVKELGLRCSFSELLEGLNLAGQTGGSMSLLMIDALNEGAGRDIWKLHIRGLLQEVGRFPHVALAVSVRTAYEPAVIPNDIAASMHRIEHKGFGGNTEDALAMFFDNNGIERPAVPLMAPEFSNPQFLTVLCKGLKNKKSTRLPDDVNGIVAVYDLFIDSVNDKLSDGNALGIPREFRIVHRAVDALAGRLVEGGRASLEYTEAYRLLSGLDPTLKNLDRLLDALISEGVLGSYSAMSEAGTRARRVRFAYERMSDNLIIKSILDAAAGDAGGPAALLKKRGPLAAYAASPARYRGLVDALSVQLPERFGTELLEAAGAGAPERELTESFLDGLIWRSPSSIGGTSVRLVDNLFKERRLPGHVLRALLTHATNPDSPLNADYLHRHLLGLEMADRDGYLAVFLHEEYTFGRHSMVRAFKVPTANPQLVGRAPGSIFKRGGHGHGAARSHKRAQNLRGTVQAPPANPDWHMETGNVLPTRRGALAVYALNHGTGCLRHDGSGARDRTRRAGASRDRSAAPPRRYVMSSSSDANQQRFRSSGSPSHVLPDARVRAPAECMPTK